MLKLYEVGIFPLWEATSQEQRNAWSHGWLSIGTLNIQGILASGLDGFGVVSLNLSRSKLSGIISPALANIQSLRVLDLSSNNMTGPIPPQLGNNLHNLEILSLFENSLNGTIPPSLGNLSNLSELLLYSNDLSGTIPLEIGLLKKLKVLRVGDNNLTCHILEEISKCTELRLMGFGSSLNGSIPITFG